MKVSQTSGAKGTTSAKRKSRNAGTASETFVNTLRDTQSASNNAFVKESPTVSSAEAVRETGKLDKGFALERSGTHGPRD